MNKKSPVFNAVSLPLRILNRLYRRSTMGQYFMEDRQFLKIHDLEKAPANEREKGLWKIMNETISHHHRGYLDSKQTANILILAISFLPEGHVPSAVCGVLDIIDRQHTEKKLDTRQAAFKAFELFLTLSAHATEDGLEKDLKELTKKWLSVSLLHARHTFRKEADFESVESILKKPPPIPKNLRDMKPVYTSQPWNK